MSLKDFLMDSFSNIFKAEPTLSPVGSIPPSTPLPFDEDPSFDEDDMQPALRYGDASDTDAVEPVDPEVAAEPEPRYGEPSDTDTEEPVEPEVAAEPEPRYGSGVSQSDSSDSRFESGPYAGLTMPQALAKYESEMMKHSEQSWCVWRDPKLWLKGGMHDYCGACIYLVSIAKRPDAPHMSTIGRVPGMPQSDIKNHLTPFGTIVENAILSIPHYFPFTMVYDYCVMPDHVHILLFMQVNSKVHLNEIIEFVTKSSSKDFREIFPQKGNDSASMEYLPDPSYDAFCCEEEIEYDTLCEAISDYVTSATPPDLSDVMSLFEDGYNDKVIRHQSILKNCQSYIQRNPLRSRLKMEHPEYFCSLLRLSLNMPDGQQSFVMYGNPWLLHEPLKVAVRISSKYSAEMLSMHEMECEEVSRSGGVLVSPFIGGEEKELLRRGMESNASIIHFVNYPLRPGFRPSIRWQQLCAQRRLLVVAPDLPPGTDRPLSREVAMSMNAAASFLATADLSNFRISRYTPPAPPQHP